MAVTKPVAFDRVQVKVICYTPTQVSENVLDFVVRSPVITGGATVQEIATVLSSVLAAAYGDFMPSIARYRGVSAQDLTEPISVPYYETQDDQAGTQGTELQATQVSGIIRKRSLQGGKANRGRLFPGFPSKDWSAATGGMNAGGLAALQQIADAIGITQSIVGAGGTTNLDLVIWHREGPVDYTLVASVEPVNEWATQRRRGQFGRANVLPF